MIDYIKCGDNVKLMQELPNECIDLTVTSPPYDNLRTYNGYTWDFESVARELYRITKYGGVVVWIVNDATINGSETGTSFRQALYFKELGFNIHDTMIWEKPSFTDTGSLKVRYAGVFEYMFVLAKGKIKTFNPIKDRQVKSKGKKKHGTIRLADGRMKSKSSLGKRFEEFGQRYNVWDINACMSNTERTGHPAQFPLSLVHDHIVSWSNESDTVFDPFMGSGTTAIAAIRTKRHYIGFDISQEYCEIANNRIAIELNEAIKGKTQ